MPRLLIAWYETECIVSRARFIKIERVEKIKELLVNAALTAGPLLPVGE
jgi:hypothetical protein